MKRLALILFIALCIKAFPYCSYTGDIQRFQECQQMERDNREMIRNSERQLQLQEESLREQRGMRGNEGFMASPTFINPWGRR